MVVLILEEGGSNGRQSEDSLEYSVRQVLQPLFRELDMKFCGRVTGSFNYVFSVQTRILWFDLRMSNIGLIYRPISMRPFGG